MAQSKLYAEAESELPGVSARHKKALALPAFAIQRRSRPPALSGRGAFAASP